ncbi:MAG TPA: NAD(P)H-hydrate dehydratase [Polyangiaceae bacterium]|nr:NAD(P)H-hydrate dehydratase [Polyangiaceae bacterium]
MLPVLSAQQMRAYDRHATDVLGVPSIELMENAGRGAAERVAALLGVDITTPVAASANAPVRVVVVAGAGNNGGDGFVVARRLGGVGVRVKTFLALPAEKLKGDALTNYQLLVESGASIVQLESSTVPLVQALEAADVVVDALFGTGLDREIDGFLAQVIDSINRSAPRCRKVALDLPSGLHADTGRVLGACVNADFTVTFAHRKLGLCTPRGAQRAGELTVVDIVKPTDPSATGISAELLEASDVERWIMRRGSMAHKSSAGRVLVVAGSPGKLGAALLSAHGAQRAGAGLVTIATSPASADALDQRVLEAMTARIDASAPDAALQKLLEPMAAAVVGPGLGLDAGARRIVDAVVLGWGGPKVVDADAISHFAGRAAELAQAKNVVLTPHAGELGRLLGVPYAEIDDDRFGAVARAVELTGAVVLLKGRYTIVGAPGSLPVVNPTGGPALATGGTGDVLSGIIAALCCELAPRDAAAAGAYLHGAAADAWSAAHGGADRGMLAHEIGDALPAALAACRTS